MAKLNSIKGVGKIVITPKSVCGGLQWLENTKFYHNIGNHILVNPMGQKEKDFEHLIYGDMEETKTNEILDGYNKLIRLLNNKETRKKYFETGLCSTLKYIEYDSMISYGVMQHIKEDLFNYGKTLKELYTRNTLWSTSQSPHIKLTPEEASERYENGIIGCYYWEPGNVEQRLEWLKDQYHKYAGKMRDEKRPKGLFNKYIIQRTDLRPLNGTDYFVLKLDGFGDPEHIKASRKAIMTYAHNIGEHLPELAEDILKKYDNFKYTITVDANNTFNDKVSCFHLSRTMEDGTTEMISDHRMIIRWESDRRRFKELVEKTAKEYNAEVIEES